MTAVTGTETLSSYASAPQQHRAVEGLKCRSSSSGESCASISRHKPPSRLNHANTETYTNHKDAPVASPTCRASVPAPSSPQAAILTTFAWSCWILCSSAAILVNKHILVDLNFPFPCTVAALGLTGTSLITNLASQITRRSSTGGHNSPALPWSYYFGRIVPASLCLALSMQLGNMAYLYLSVAYIQMLKAFSPVVTMLLAFLFGLERPSMLLILSVCLITAGVSLASWGEGSISILGVTVMMTSKVCEAMRLVLTQAMVSQQKSPSSVRVLAHLTTAASIWLLLIAGATEALEMHQRQAVQDILKHPGVLLASAVLGFGANSMAMLVITLSGALSLKCLGLAKDVGLVIWGVVALGEVVSALQGFGYCISLAGFGLFNLAKHAAAGPSPTIKVQRGWPTTWRRVHSDQDVLRQGHAHSSSCMTARVTVPQKGSACNKAARLNTPLPSGELHVEIQLCSSESADDALQPLLETPRRTATPTFSKV